MAKIGEVVVVAPDSPQSGKGHAITLDQPLRISSSTRFGNEVTAYKCSGTPADCIKFGKRFILKDRKIDLVVSGINHGVNSSISVIYSGTMSAAIEAAIEGIPAIGFSLCDHSLEADFSHVEPFVLAIAQKVLDGNLPKGIALNVNIPKKSTEDIKGIKFCRQAKAVFREIFHERNDPFGKPYFWVDGYLENNDTMGGTDEDALKENYVSIVPVQYDLTAYAVLEELNDWKFN